MEDIALFIGYFVIMFIVFGGVAALIAYVIFKVKGASNKKTPIVEEPVRYVTPHKPSVESSPEKEFAKRIVEEQIKRQQEEIEKKGWIESIDRLEFIACVTAAKECLPKLIGILEQVEGGQGIAKNLKKKAGLSIYEFVILCSAYNNLFIDKNGRGHFANNENVKYDFRNGYYRLCRLANSLIFQKKSITHTDVDRFEQRIRYYADELDFMRKSTYALPVHILYPLFYPQEEIDYNKSVKKIDLITCVGLWKMIVEHITLDLPKYNEKH